MKPSLQPGLTHEFKFRVPESKTVPHRYPESPEFKLMPDVFATGFMVGLCERTCIQAINPHIDRPPQQTVEIHLNLSHLAATPPGLSVSVKTTLTLTEIKGRKLTFSIVAVDSIDIIPCTPKN